MLHSVVYPQAPVRLNLPCPSYTSFNSFPSCSLPYHSHLTPFPPVTSELFSHFFLPGSPATYLESSAHTLFPCTTEGVGGVATLQRRPGLRVCTYKPCTEKTGLRVCTYKPCTENRGVLSSDSFCHFKISSSFITIVYGLFDENMGVGVSVGANLRGHLVPLETFRTVFPASNIQSPASRTDELSSTESYSCAKLPGGGVPACRLQ